MKTPMLDGIKKEAYGFGGMHGLGYGAVNKATGGKMPESIIGGGIAGGAMSASFPLVLGIAGLSTAGKGARVQSLLDALKKSGRALPGGIAAGAFSGLMGHEIANRFMKLKRIKRRMGNAKEGVST